MKAFKHERRRPPKFKGRRPLMVDGVPVRNGRRLGLQVNITPKDIRAGVRQSPSECAGALAAVRDIPHCTKAHIHNTVMYLMIEEPGKPPVCERYKTPAGLRIEQVAYDRGGDMQPDDYILMPMNERKPGRRQGSDAPGARDRGSNDRTPKFKRAQHLLVNVREQARKA